jgi:hypothetical protein
MGRGGYKNYATNDFTSIFGGTEQGGFFMNEYEAIP